MPQPDGTDKEIVSTIDLAFSAYGNADMQQAERLCRGVLEKAPNQIEAMQLLGLIYGKQGKYAEAAELLHKAIQIKPDSAKIHNNLGVALMQLGNLEQAQAAFEKAIALQTDFKQAYNNLGLVLKKHGRVAESEAVFEKAIMIDAKYAEALGNLGVAFLLQRKFEDAAENLQKAIELKPNLAEFHNNLGNALMELYRFDEAIAAFDKAIEIEPQSAQPHHNRSLVLILTGQFEQGWKEYQWRWKNSGFSTPLRPFKQKMWDGAAIAGKLLVWGEQGIGDEVQFSGLIQYIVAKGIKVIAECDKRLVPILQRSLPQITVVPRTDPPAELLNDASITHQIPMCSIPLALGWPMDLKPHLVADENLRNQLRGRYKNGKKVLLAGISWRSGNTQEGPKRSIDLEYWEPVLKIAGVKFISLQYGQCQKQLQEANQRFGIEILKDETINPMTDLEGFAAQTAAMDIIISVDNSTVHFAGAMGVKVWTLLPKVPDWRWGLEGEKTCWYPSMRLFRQKERGNWQPVISNVAQELRSLI
ncbi:MAG: hypothetical protein A2Y10_04675 [Planctomycetes bacterium GWF2_41_51]|nr:MAG: hypothetical protein A2Y10_04675 [Planctomycetes bacterium GWF2_41_51]HBG26630.1 hypothetical protein [Phycisphaerales bacterium]